MWIIWRTRPIGTDWRKVVYTGPIDRYFDYCYGPLEYRMVRFETEVAGDTQLSGQRRGELHGPGDPWTRIIEHKHFVFEIREKTVISRNTVPNGSRERSLITPSTTGKTGELYRKYRTLADKETKTLFGGRLGEYKYYDMDVVIASALRCVKAEL